MSSGTKEAQKCVSVSVCASFLLREHMAPLIQQTSTNHKMPLSLW